MRQETISGIPNIPGPVTIDKPTSPYVGKIPDWLMCGTTVTIRGKAELEQKGFSVNFSSQPCIDPMPDTALHLDMRLKDKVIVLNHIKNGKWGSEERIQHKFPLQQDLSFELMILITKHEFMIFFFGNYYLSFPQRIGQNAGKFLIIKGSVQLEQIRIDGTTLVPPVSLKPDFPAIYHPKTPFISKILGGLHVQKIITISGYPFKYNAKRFTVNLMAEKDNALHFDVRLDQESFKNVIIRNSLISNYWGEEETFKPCFPFHPGVGFDLMLIVEPRCYKIAVNSQHFITFQHRVKNLETVKHIQIHGDVHLNMVQFH